MPLITLTTDFGLNDEYVGVMKGVILSRCPGTDIVDLTHGIKPQDIRGATYVIEASYPYFPDNTVHVVVVDPGVGGERKVIALRTQGQTFLAPDNGVLTSVFAEAEKKIFEVRAEDLFLPRLSNTFHGRDIFAPVAAHLACGLPLDQLGPGLPESQVERLILPEITVSKTTLKGSIVYIDNFGNLITNLDHRTVGAFCKNNFNLITIQIKDTSIAGITRSYSTGDPWGPAALFNSRGYLEIAVPMGSAARDLVVSRDEPVHLRIRDRSS